VKVTTPHMGAVHLLLTDLFERLGVEYLPAPPTTQKTMKLGLQYSPEFACLPLKLTVGNLIEGLESGADATLMVGGCGPCRFGYYADIQRRIIDGLGYDYESIILEPPSQDFRAFLDTIRRLAPGKGYWEIWQAFRVSFRKGQAFDRIERKTIESRCFEVERGQTDQVREQATQLVVEAKSLSDIISDTLVLVRLKLAQGKVALHFNPPAKPVVVDAQKGQIQQVLLNLLLNATQAMPDGGTITVTVTGEDRPTGRVAHTDITDTGRGIPEQVRERMFDSFLSGRPDGTGLGLAIAKRILLSHHGDIVLLQTGPSGTTMRITLPVAK
jgi:signal transduction histidine kinase